MKNTPAGFEGIDGNFLENIEYIVNDYIMLARDFELYKRGGLIGKGVEVKTLHRHNPSKFQRVFEILLKGEIEEFPEDLLIGLEKLLTELRELYKEVKKLDLQKKGKLLNFIQKGIDVKQRELGFILPSNYKEIFLKALQLDKVEDIPDDDYEYIPDEVVSVYNKEIGGIMKLKN